MELQVKSDKDQTLKLLTKLLFEQMGFVAEAEVQITAKSYHAQYAREQISDYDVLGIRFEKDLTFRRIAAECKSGESKALEELLKLSGIMAAFQIERGYFVKTRIHQNAREVAAGIRVTTLDEQEIRDLLSTAFKLDVPAVLLRQEAAARKLDELTSSLQTRFQAVHHYLMFEFWGAEPHRNLQNIIKLSRGLRTTTKDDDPLHHYLFYRLTYHFTITLLQLAGKVLATSFGQPDRGIAVFVFGGPRERREREVLFDHLNRLLTTKGADASKFEPDYLGPLAEVVVRIVRSAPSAAAIPQFLANLVDHIYFGMELLDSKPLDDIVRKLAQDIGFFLIRHSGLPKTLGSELLAL